MNLATLEFIAGTLPTVTQVAGGLLSQIGGSSSAISIYNVPNTEEVSKPEPTTTPSSTKSTNTEAGQTTQQIPITYEPTKQDIEDVKAILKNNVEVTEAQLKQVAKKYHIIDGYNKQNNIKMPKEQLNTRIINYAKCLNYDKTEDKYNTFFNNDESDGINYNGEEYTRDGMTGFKTQKEFVDAYMNFAEEQIEGYDDEKGDGKIDFNEFIAREEARVGSIYDDKMKAGARKVFDFLDKDGNDTIDKREMAAYLWAMSNINEANGNSSDNDIKYKEWLQTQLALSYIGDNSDGIGKDAADKFKKNFEIAYNGFGV